MFARRTEKLKAKKMKETKVTRDKERRHRQPWYLEFASARGKKWLEKAMQDDAFRLGMGAKVHVQNPVNYSIAVQMKRPKAYSLEPYDFTNRYLGGPRQC